MLQSAHKSTTDLLSSLGISSNWEKKSASGTVGRPKVRDVPLTTKETRNPLWPEAIAIDCEMVGAAPLGHSVVARVALVDEYGKVLMDEFVKPEERIIDFRGAITGITWENLKNGKSLRVIRRQILPLIQNKVLVGHDLRHDLKVLRVGQNEVALLLNVPAQSRRDTSTYRPLSTRVLLEQNTRKTRVSLKDLSVYWLSRKIQDGTHDPTEDAKAAMDLYVLHREAWESAMENDVKSVLRKRTPKCSSTGTEVRRFSQRSPSTKHKNKNAYKEKR